MRHSHSYSKRGTLDSCLRKYFFEYYASAKKLPFDAGQKDLIRGLKGFTNTHMLAGESLHWFIEQRLKKGISSQAWAERTALDQFERAVRYSRDPERMGHMRADKYPPPMLLEFYYQDPRADDLVTAAREGLQRGIRHFLREGAVVSLWGTITAGEHWVEKRVSKLPKIDGYGIDGQIDLAGRDGGVIRIVDWKSGVQVGGHDSFQMLIYGLWAEKEFAVKPDDVRVQRVFLGGPTVEQEKALDRTMLRAGRARLIQDIELMEDLDPYGREGNEEAFSPCMKANVCRQCSYQQACKANCSGLAPRRTFASLPLLKARA
ncbi:MAG: PD-(D/E)XK nuclease family protein [Gemmataceae bacterium]|nr:PD-(D/E)XK nuclease family protein [Gemmataceae bacterium]